MKRKVFLATIIVAIVSVCILYFTQNSFSSKKEKSNIIENKLIDNAEIEESDADNKENNEDEKKDIEIVQVNPPVDETKTSESNKSTTSNNSTSQSNTSSTSKNTSTSSTTEKIEVKKEEQVEVKKSNVDQPKNDGNQINRNSLDYPTHKGRMDNCDSNSSCMNIAINFYLKYKKNIANYYVIDVVANNGNVLGYFIEYVFKEGSYNSENECNSVGSSIKSELSDRVTGYKCSNRDNKYYLSITTDYD